MFNLLLHTVSQVQRACWPVSGPVVSKASESSDAPWLNNVGDILGAHLASLGYQSPTPLTFDLTLEAEVLSRLTSWSLGVEKDPYSVKALRCSIGMANYAFHKHSFETKIYISLFTWFSMIIDDRVTAMRIPLEHFHGRLLNAEPQLDPLLDHLASLLKETPRHWDPVCASSIICSFLGFLGATLFLDRDEVQSKRGVIESQSWPPYLRTKDGEPEAYAYMVFPRETCPDISVYLQAIPDMCIFINANNDVLSFYKEEAAGETHNLVHGRAKASGNSPLSEVKSISKEGLEAVYRVRAMLQGKGSYEEAWRTFEHGYVTFHTAGNRYKLKELGLGEDMVEAASDTHVPPVININAIIPQLRICPTIENLNIVEPMLNSSKW
ncbi:isoprenoid synthase domain-containing protein [Mycena floridula]|nr:isoprenoid synthase domain-containing protein [Mycena floridula]